MFLNHYLEHICIFRLHILTTVPNAVVYYASKIRERMHQKESDPKNILKFVHLLYVQILKPQKKTN